MEPSANMAGFERNGEPFAAYFNRWELMSHVMTLESGEVVAFAISGAEGRGALVYSTAFSTPRRVPHRRAPFCAGP